jgi:CubicO group peptidase (beta-lactamase class C family)
MRFRPVLAAALLVLASPAPAAAEAGLRAEVSLPAEWTQRAEAGFASLVAPEGDLTLSIVEVGPAADAGSAAAAAWRRLRPDPVAAPQLSSPSGPGNGWAERVGLTWETPPALGAVRSATALRQGSDWTVLLLEGSAATLSKRLAAVQLVQQSLRPAGHAPEDFSGRTAHRLTPDRVDLLRRFVADSAAALGVPGVGLAFIDQGRVVWQGGVGVRAVGSSDPVDADTRFMIASNTKGMATLLLSILADEGRLRWDQPVVDLYPGFRLGSAETTAATRVRHLVCACTGLPRRDMAFILAEPGAPASETFDQLATTLPTSGFGEIFQYNNLMASAAGYIGGALAYPRMEVGAAFDRAMETRIFRPLGMRRTTFDFAKGMRGNWAEPHGVDLDGRIVRLDNDFNATVLPHRPAGGAFSTAADMARYVQLELSKGVAPDGRRLVSEANILERRRRGVAVGENSWYGMGLFERIAWGVPVVTHGGTLAGYHSSFYVLPEAGVGAVILTNADPGAAMLGPFLRRLIEILYDGRPEADAEIEAAAARIRAQAAARRARLTLPPDPDVIAGLAPAYRSPEGLEIRVFSRDGQPWIRAGFIEGPLATRRNADGSQSLVTAGAGLVSLDALVGRDGETRTLAVRDSQQVYVYQEVR